MRKDYVRSQDRKRRLVSLGLTALLYATAAGALWIAGALAPDTLSAYSGPITVRLGSPSGTDETSRVLPSPNATPDGKGIPAAPPAPVAPAAKAASPAAPSVPAARTPKPATQAARAASPVSAPAVSPAKPGATAEPQKASPNALVLPKDDAGKNESPKSPSTATNDSSAAQTASSGQSGSGATPAATGTGINGSAAEGPAVSTGPISVKGSENGNAYETNFESGSGRIGRGLYVPIFLFMPLPFSVDDSVYAKIPAGSGGLRTAEQRRTAFRSAYELKSGVWRLKAQPGLEARPELWKTLEDSGYPIARAEYKSGRTLSPVVLSFRVSAAAKGKMPTLESVEVVSSSGSPDIDAAVVYGFRQAAFYNDGSSSVTGRFTYRFD